MKRRYPSVTYAKAGHPTVLRRRLDHDVAIEYWNVSRVRKVAADDVSTPGPLRIEQRPCVFQTSMSADT